MLETLLPLIGGGIFGAVVKLISLRMQMKNEEHKQMLQALSQRQENINAVNEIAVKNKGFAWTRRFIVVSVTLIVVGAFFVPFLNGEMIINVQNHIQAGGQYLLGLVDTRTTNSEWIQLSGAVILPEIGYSFQAIIGTYFGASIAGRN